MTGPSPTRPRLHHGGGEGVPAVLLHGFGADRMSWLANRGELAREVAVHALDLPGHGETPPAGAGGFGEMVDAVAAALDDAALGPAHLVAHSLGGAVAVAVAAARPDLVRSLALFAPAGLGAAVDTTFLDDFVAARDPAEVEAVLVRLVSRPRLVNRHMVARVVEQLSDPGYRETLAAIAGDLKRMDDILAPDVGAVAASPLPRLVVWGALDTVAPPDPVRLDRFGGERVILPDAAHMPQVENAREVNERLLAWFAAT